MQLEPETAGRLHSLLPLHSRGSALTGISVPSPTAADPSSSPTGRRAGQAPPSALSIEGTHVAGVPQLGRGRRGRGSWSWCSQPTSVFVPSCAGDRGPSHPDREAGGLSMGLRRGSVLPLGLGSSSQLSKCLVGIQAAIQWRTRLGSCPEEPRVLQSWPWLQKLFACGALPAK